MRRSLCQVTLTLLGLFLAGTTYEARQPQASSQDAAAGQDRSQRLYPSLQRPPGDPERIARGQAVYGISCRACHGADLRGGDLGGPNLLRSQVVLKDDQGDLVGPVIRDGQSSADGDGMPPQSLSEEDIGAVVEFIRDVLGTASRQGGPPPGDEVALDILVGDATAGQTYFAATCASCHSPTGDLQDIGARISEPQELQNTWVRGTAAGGGERPPVRVTVTEASGERVEGELERLNDFLVVLTEDDGRHRSFRRRGDTPLVELDDPMAVHRELLPLYSDTDIHNVTAYLVTLQ
jgi:cytochrome c oxidase cbb3-type subunit 3